MTFTILSLLVSFFSQISRILQARQTREKKFLNKDRATMRMIIKSIDLRTHHAFAHQKIEQCVQDIFDASEDLTDLHHRRDVSFSIEVFSIKNLTKTKQSLIVMFESIILTQDHSDANNSFRKLIMDNLKNIGVNRHSINVEMINVCISFFFCDLRHRGIVF